LAYQYFLPIPSLADTLEIFLSTDCGINYSSIYKKGGDDLSTFTTSSANFVPLSAEQWRTEYIDITSFATNNVNLKFVSYNKSGNNMYIDNIWVYQGIEPVGISINELVENKISIYPNPTNKRVTIDLGVSDLNNATIEIFDLIGKTIYQQKVTSKVHTINLVQIQTGVYIVKFSNKMGVFTQKLIKR
jgi:hypothetical protein